MQIRLNIRGKEQVIELTDPRVKQQKAATQRKYDEQDQWPAKSRQTQSRNREVPNKKATKRRSKQKHASDWNGCGVGANTTKGYRAAAGLLRAIHADETGCIVATPSRERRLHEHMLPTTDVRFGTGMRYTDRKGAKSS